MLTDIRVLWIHRVNFRHWKHTAGTEFPKNWKQSASCNCLIPAHGTFLGAAKGQVMQEELHSHTELRGQKSLGRSRGWNLWSKIPKKRALVRENP